MGLKFKARLGANENCFGPSPKVIEAMQNACPESWKYGDPENHDLRNALAHHCGVRPENIMIGEGIDGLFSYLARLFVEPGDNVVSSLGSYPTFNFHIKSAGGNVDLLPYVDDHEDPGTLVKRAALTDSKLLYFSNPNNPMGTWHDADRMQEMFAQVPERTILVLDEAYVEMAPDGVAPPVDVSRPNILRFRTFSKAYGLAGARVGYVIGHEKVISAFDKVRNHYGMNRTGQIGALVALEDEDYLQEVKKRFFIGRERLAKIARDNGMVPIPSATNFVAMDCGNGPAFAKAVLKGLLGRGVFVRMPGYEPQSRCIRVSVGLDSELDIFAEELPKVMNALGA